jgi:hypothetical protein
MNASKFTLGFGFILVGFAIASGVNYLDMRQFQERIGGWVSNDSPLGASGIYQSLKSQDEYSKKNFTPETASVLMRDYSTVNQEAKQDFREIQKEVSKKEQDALRNMGVFGLLASLSLMNYSIIRKSQNRKSGLAGVPV